MNQQLLLVMNQKLLLKAHLTDPFLEGGVRSAHHISPQEIACGPAGDTGTIQLGFLRVCP